MTHIAGVFASGVLFALGLGLSGMTHPQKIIGFLDLLGAWDPSLALVMGGAVATHAALYRLIRRRPSPLFGASFRVPTRRDVDAKLVTGAALFGVGWGLAGFCPGPALVALLSGSPAVFVFVASMLLGMTVHDLLSRPRASTGAAGELSSSPSSG